MEFGWGKRARSWAGFEDLQTLAAKFGVGARPRLESAEAIQNFGGCAREIDQTIFFLQDWGEARLGVVLLAGMDCAGLQSLESFDDEVGPDCCEARGEGFGGVVGWEGKFFL